MLGKAASPFCEGGSEGEGEVEVRDSEAIMVVAWRFARLLVATDTLIVRDLNRVRLSSRAAVASSCIAVSAKLNGETVETYFCRKNHKSHALALTYKVRRNSNLFYSTIL